jgi:histidinol-phosphatase (PHP family)
MIMKGFKMFDNHIHTIYSKDSGMQIEEAVLKAIELGLKGIAITDHIDYEMPGFDDFYIDDINKYIKDVLMYKEKYKDKLTVTLGIETGQTQGTYKKNEELLNNYKFDYVLSAIHVVNGEDVYQKSYFELKGKKKSYELYLEAVFNAIENFPDFDMFAHLDYVIRKAPYKDKSMNYSDFSDYFDEIFKSLIYKGKGFELNTGVDKFLSIDEVFDINILKRYKELGGEKICIGSDAHDKNRIASNYEYCAYALKKAGFKYLTCFLDRNPVYLEI